MEMNKYDWLINESILDNIEMTKLRLKFIDYFSFQIYFHKQILRNNIHIQLYDLLVHLLEHDSFNEPIIVLL